MAPRKKKPTPARKAAKPPVLNLKATEVKSATEKVEIKATAQETSKPERKTTGGGTTRDGKPAEKSNTSASSKPTSDKPATSKPVGGAKPGKATGEKKKSGKSGIVLVGLAVLIAAGLGGAWAFKTYGAKYFADPNAVRAEQLARVVARVAKLEAIATENKSTSELAAGLKKQFDQNSAALTANKAIIQGNLKKLADLEKTADEVRVALAKAVEDGKGPVAVANELQFQALTQKFATLEKGLSTLEGAPSGNAKTLGSLKTRLDAILVRLNATEEQTGAVAKSIALVNAAQEKFASAPAANPASEAARTFTILRAKISQGGPFESELNTMAGQMPEETALDILRPFARSGAPTVASLINALNKIEVTARPSAAEKSASDEGSMFGALSNRLSGLVKVTKAGQSDWSELKQKAQQALGSGQVAGAVKILRAGVDVPAAVGEWLALADKKIKIDQAVKDLSAKIVARLTAGSQ